VPNCPGLDSGSLALGPKANLRLSPQSFDQTNLARTSCSSPLVLGSPPLLVANWQADGSKTIRNPFRQHPLQTSLQNYNLQDQWERHPSLSLDDGIGTASLSMDGRMDGRILELLMERQAILQGTLRAGFAAISRPPPIQWR